MDFEFNAVRENATKFNGLVSKTPTFVPKEWLEKFVENVQEELKEILEAQTLEEQAREVGDLLYYTLGAFVAMGVRPGGVFDAIHKANMSKIPVTGQRKHSVKPPNFIGPQAEIASDIEFQINNTEVVEFRSLFKS